VVDLTTTYLGLRLSSPLVPAASPLSRTLDALKRLEDAGAGAVVLYSLFQEQIEPGRLDPFLAGGEGAAAGVAFPAAAEYRAGPEEYLEHVRRAKAALGIPVIASLNGVSAGPWAGCAGLLDQAGADALELNLCYLPADLFLAGAAIEQAQVELLQEVAVRVGVPVAVKLGPLYTNVASLARRLEQAGARGLVLFNRLHLPEVDPGTLEPVPAPLSAPGDRPASLLALHWVALLHGRVGADLAAVGGVHTAEDAARALLTGASVVQLASALLVSGIGYLRALREGLAGWLEAHGYASVEQARGATSRRGVGWPAAAERAAYLRQIGATHPPGLPWSHASGEAR
jgi:dihydroorotate dehydrogenase (fumarate)